MENTTKKKSIISKILIFIIGVIIGGGSLWTWNYYMPKSASSVSQTDQSQIKSLIEKAGKLVILPTGEDPVVATISDAASLIKEQIFYKNAINGDVVLVYQKAAKAVVYSPSRNIIVNVGPIFLQDNTQTSTSTSPTATSSKK